MNNDKKYCSGIYLFMLQIRNSNKSNIQRESGGMYIFTISNIMKILHISCGMTPFLYLLNLADATKAATFHANVFGCLQTLHYFGHQNSSSAIL